MDNTKRAKLEAAGWVVSDTKEFLNLSKEEDAIVEVKVAIALALRAKRAERHLSQVEVAKLLGSSQSRVAKMEAADSSVSFDLLLRSFLRLGGTRQSLAEAFS